MENSLTHYIISEQQENLVGTGIAVCGVRVLRPGEIVDLSEDWVEKEYDKKLSVKSTKCFILL